MGLFKSASFSLLFFWITFDFRWLLLLRFKQSFCICWYSAFFKWTIMSVLQRVILLNAHGGHIIWLFDFEWRSAVWQVIQCTHKLITSFRVQFLLPVKIKALKQATRIFKKHFWIIVFLSFLWRRYISSLKDRMWRAKSTQAAQQKRNIRKTFRHISKRRILL